MVQKTNHSNMPAYAGAVFLYHGARADCGVGLASAKYDGLELSLIIDYPVVLLLSNAYGANAKPDTAPGAVFAPRRLELICIGRLLARKKHRRRPNASPRWA